jgi:predicted dehydrogenase
MRYLLNDDIVEVSALASSLNKKGADGKPIGVSDNMICLLKTKKNIIGTLAVSWTYYGPEDNSTMLYCEKGIMKLYADPAYAVQISNMDGEETLHKVGQIQTNDRQSNSGVIDSFIDSIINKKAPLISGEDGYKGLQVVLAAMQSSETGKAVKI